MTLVVSSSLCFVQEALQSNPRHPEEEYRAAWNTTRTLEAFDVTEISLLPQNLGEKKVPSGRIFHPLNLLGYKELAFQYKSEKVGKFSEEKVAQRDANGPD